MQAIMTTYKGPTDHKGSRIIARCQARRVTVPWNHALDIEDNHRAAAETLASLMGWCDPIRSGALPDGHSYAHVF